MKAPRGPQSTLTCGRWGCATCDALAAYMVQLRQVGGVEKSKTNVAFNPRDISRAGNTGLCVDCTLLGVIRKVGLIT